MTGFYMKRNNGLKWVKGHKTFLENVSITFIGNHDPSDPENRDNYWAQRLNTMTLWGFKCYKKQWLIEL